MTSTSQDLREGERHQTMGLINRIDYSGSILCWFRVDVSLCGHPQYKRDPGGLGILLTNSRIKFRS